MTLPIKNLSLRVDGVPQLNATVRLSIVDGYPCGPKQLVVDDPVVGEIVLTDDCLIEISQFPGSWVLVKVSELLKVLEQAAQASVGEEE